jgi:CO/xanthine dehydrogenase Mo-binding subunit
MSPITSRVIGVSVKRKEDPRLLTGRGKYAADVRLPGLLRAAVLRSPHPHARLAALRADAARALPGVAAVITADDLGPVGRIPVRLGQRPGPTACLQPPLATGTVRYVGEPVAFVVAASRYLAEDALELIEVDWEPLPVVADVRRASEGGAPVLHPAAGSNVVERLLARAGNPAGALAGADVRLCERFAIQRHTGVPMETRGLTAAHDAGTGVLTLWGVAKVPHFNARAAVPGPPGMEPGLYAAHFFLAPKMTYPYGTRVAVVEVDPATGQVAILHYAITYDVGRAINPMIIDGQIVGGLAQGIGGALFEDLVYDAEGQPLTTTFMDYLVPTALEMPEATTVKILEETPTPLNPLGVKGVGEGGSSGTGAAIANAVADALAPLGVPITELPLSPDRLAGLLRGRLSRE